MISIFDQIKDSLPKDRPTSYLSLNVDISEAQGFNDCKKLYDEVLKRAGVDENKVYDEFEKFDKIYSFKRMFAKALSTQTIITVKEK